MIKELFSEKASISMTRLMSIICIIAACIVAFYGVYVGRDLMGLAALCSSFIAPAFAGKVIQKKMEVSSNK